MIGRYLKGILVPWDLWKEERGVAREWWVGRGEGPLGVNVQAGGVELTQGGRIPPPASCTSGGELSSAAERESGKMREDNKTLAVCRFGLSLL